MKSSMIKDQLTAEETLRYAKPETPDEVLLFDAMRNFVNGALCDAASSEITMQDLDDTIVNLKDQVVELEEQIDELKADLAAAKAEALAAEVKLAAIESLLETT